MKPRYIVLFLTILVSFGFYFLIEPIVAYCIDFSNVKGAVVSFFNTISMVFKIMGLFIVLLNATMLYFIQHYKKKGNTEMEKGFSYSFIYTISLLCIYGLIWIVRI